MYSRYIVDGNHQLRNAKVGENVISDNVIIYFIIYFNFVEAPSTLSYKL